VTTAQPVRKQIVVDAPIDRAFRVFTKGSWWPPEHHIGASPLKQMEMEGHPGGRWYSICQDGSECDVGKVLAWEPPRRLVLAWQLKGDWQYDPSFVTELEITFVAEGAKRTRVALEHRNLERYGDAAEQVRTSIDAPGGWALTLEAFGKAAAAEDEPAVGSQRA
jgi:uncharacterized protein YndB with AHSA1/START domain